MQFVGFLQSLKPNQANGQHLITFENDDGSRVELEYSGQPASRTYEPKYAIFLIYKETFAKYIDICNIYFIPFV